MLIGTTYAWFTDAVASSGNIIKSGTLKIDVLVKGGDIDTAGLDAIGVTSDSGYYSLKSANEKNTNVPIFNYHLWEPGYTDWANVKVVNNGTLALKYTMRIIASGTVSELAEVIDVYYAPYEVAKPATRDLSALRKIGTLKDVLEGGAGVIINDYLLAGNDQNYAPDFATIALHMQESAGNEYQNLEIGSYFELQILATQYTYESDSFDNMYDDAALFPVVPVNIMESTSAGFHALGVETADVVISSANAVSIVPMNTTIVGAEDQNGAVGLTNSTGELTRTIDTDRDENSVTYDISYQYTTTEAGVSTTVDVTKFSEIITNELRIEKDLQIVKVTHSHGGTVAEMTKLASADEDAEGYFYDHTTGILTIKSSKYSEFTVEFDRKKAVTTVTVEPGSVTMDVGETADITPSVLPDDATYKTVAWSSSDSSAVSVDKNGVVTAIKAGVYTVTATADGVSSACTVTVYADAKIGDTYFAKVGDAFAAAQDNDTIELLRDTEAGISIHGINDLTFKMNGFTLSSLTGCAFTLYDCDGVTIENGTVNGQFRIGEHQYTIVKWKSSDETPIYGYHPLAPAKNVLLKDLTVNTSGSSSIFRYTNIEDDLTRANVSNPFDQDLYGRYIYKTGYETYLQILNRSYDEVFTACSDKDSVTVNGGIYICDGNMTGIMYDINGNLYTDVLTVVDGTFTNPSLGRYVQSGKYLVGTSSESYVVTDSAPSDYTGRVDNVYFTFAGGANAAINYARFGEVVYIKENANARKMFEQGDELTVVYEADGISYTGAAADSKYTIKTKAAEGIENGYVFYTDFNVVAAVYATGQGGNWRTAELVGEYATLKLALENFENNYTLVILKDFTVGDEMSYAYGGGTFSCALGFANRATIDFNGHVITYTGSGACIVSSQQSGLLYIRDTSAEKTGGIVATNGYCFQKRGPSTGTENFYIYGGTFISKTKQALSIDQFGTNNFEISGGTFIGKSNAIGGLSAGKITLKGGSFSHNPTNCKLGSGYSIFQAANDLYVVASSTDTIGVYDENDAIALTAGQKTYLGRLVRAGKTMKGLYDAPTGGNKIADPGTYYTAPSDMTVYAQFEVNTYTVSVVATNAVVKLNGTAVNGDITAAYGDEITVETEYTAPNHQELKIEGTTLSNGKFTVPDNNVKLSAYSTNDFWVTIGTLSNASLTISINDADAKPCAAGDRFDVETGSKVVFAAAYTETNSKKITVNGTAYSDVESYTIDSIDTDYTVSASSSKSSSCFVEGTLVTLADGTMKAVEDLTGDEILLVWNLDTGKYDAAPIVFVDSDPVDDYEVMYASFSDGSEVGVVYEHGFFDLDLGKYVYISENTVNDYIGHRFVKQSGITGGAWDVVTLTGIRTETVNTRVYSPVTAVQLNYFTNGILSMPGGIEGLFNIFDVDTTAMKYDAEAMENDIQTYGLLTIDDFNGMITEEMFEVFNGKYLGIAVGKGNITWDHIAYLAERYAPLCD